MLLATRLSTGIGRTISSYTRYSPFTFGIGLRMLSTDSNGIASALSGLDLSPTNVNPGALINGEWKATGKVIDSYCPTTGKSIGKVQLASDSDYTLAVDAAKSAQTKWRNMPAPARGQVLLAMRTALADNLSALSQLVSLENGKILPEATGEVQEFIDIADFAVGLSRSLNGFTMPSERPGHAMMEMYNPLGTVGIISAFNFPVAVFGWAASIALVCGNPVVWKPSETTPLISIAVVKILQDVLKKEGLPPGIVSLVCGAGDIGSQMAADRRLDLVSFTGSTKTGRQVGMKIQERFGKPLLELGGNNAMIIMNDADMDLAVRAVLFAAVGTAGQRCTTCRRLLVQEDVYDTFIERLIKAYKNVRIGDPLDSSTLVGPLHTKKQVDDYNQLLQSVASSGKVLYGDKLLTDVGPQFVLPSITQVEPDHPALFQEVFVPVLHTTKFKTFEDAVRMNNSVGQGLSSALFTKDIGNVFRWVGPSGSDCGIVNVNIGSSGAEVGGAFGGEKETGGGRQAGSDSWKLFMRRQTCTINYSGELPLAQGIKFE